MVLLGSSSLLTSPAVGVLIESGDEPEFDQLGLESWTTYTKAVIQESDEKIVGSIGMLLVWHASSLLLSLGTLKLLRARCESLGAGNKIGWLYVAAGRILLWLSIAYVLVVLYLLPASFSLLSARDLPKVDVSIVGMEELTSKQYLILLAELEDSYSFHVPIDQTILNVPRDRVQHMIVKGRISAFAPRHHFRKGPWLGLEMESLGVAEDGTIGVTIASVSIGSPAQRLGLLAGDLILEFNGSPVNWAYEVGQAVESAEIGQVVTLKIQRGDYVETAELVLAARP